MHSCRSHGLEEHGQEGASLLASELDSLELALQTSKHTEVEFEYKTKKVGDSVGPRHLFVLTYRQHEVLLLGVARWGRNTINVSVSCKVPLVGDRQRVGVLCGDAAGRDAQHPPVFSSP